VKQKLDRSERWEEFKRYNRMDVEAERAIWERLNDWAPWTPEEQRLWEMDRRINERGVPVDVPMVETAVEVAERERQHLAERCQALTGISPSKTGALLRWAQEHGYPGDTLQAKEIEQWLAIPF
jgi:DNA polymerase